MNVMVVAHQGKETGLVHALAATGNKFVDDIRTADCLFVDSDDPLYGKRRELLETAAGMGKATFLYPHGAGTMVCWDGQINPFPVTAQFVIGEGQVEVMRRYGYGPPLYPVGWWLCPQLPFRPVKQVRRVLFGPIHPPSNPNVPPIAARVAANSEAFEKCLSLGLELTVRYLGDFDDNGLRYVHGVRYVQGHFDNSVKEIDDADLVVGMDTFGSLAVARGKPVVHFSQDSLSFDDITGELGVKSWERYGDYMRYPIDLADGPVSELVAQAAAGTPEIEDWRRLFIGAEFHPRAFASMVERLSS